MPDDAAPAVYFKDVIEKELEAIKKMRECAVEYGIRESDNSAQVGPHVEMPTGLAFSGGGIRSATFHLGLLQALAANRLLPSFDYLSAVSGGGYIASWLCKWISLTSYRRVLQSLPRSPTKPEPDYIHHLRKNSSYLTPRLGLLGDDSLLLVITYLHQLFLINIVIMLLASLLLLLPRLVLLAAKHLYVAPQFIANCTATIGAGAAMTSLYLIAAYYWRARTRGRVAVTAMSTRARWMLGSAIVLVLGSFAVSLCYTGIYPQWLNSVIAASIAGYLINRYWETARPRTSGETRQKVCAVLGIVSAFPIVLTLYRNASTSWPHSSAAFTLLTSALVLPSRRSQVTIGALGVILFMALAVFLKQKYLIAATSAFRRVDLDDAKFSVAAVLTALLASYTVYRTRDLLHHLGELKQHLTVEQQLDDLPMIIVWIVPMSVVLGALIFTLLLAILSRHVRPYVRESSMRTIAQGYKLLILWMITAALCFYGPLVIEVSGFAVRGWSGASWAVAAALCFIMGQNVQIGPFRNGRLRRFLANSAFATFVCGCWLLLSFGCSRILLQIRWRDWSGYWRDVQSVPGLPLIYLSLAVLLSLLALSSRLGINSSSMHLFYQSCLARTYLQENLPATRHGEDPLTLDRLTFADSAGREQGYSGPYLLLNATLNLVHVEDLAFQERLAASFVFSPLFCGYEQPPREQGTRQPAFRRTQDFSYGDDRGIRLAHAMSISGSALSTSMGRDTSSRVRFVHTVLNIRLGWWLSNPSYPRAWSGDLPRSRVSLLWNEIRGGTDDRGPYVHLSDGGHFDNLGIYELIRRRCSVILACDASEDSNCSMTALGNVIAKVRIDFGFEIKLNAPDLLTEPRSQKPVAVGRIRYDSDPTHDGIFIYAKAIMNDLVPFDVRAFKIANPDFPNDSTVNQWFTESRFESYRALGYSIGEQISAELNSGEGEHSLCSKALTLLRRKETV
jgi:hypothetical protein